MGNGNPIVLSADVWAGGPAGHASNESGTITDVHFENVTAQAENGIFVSDTSRPVLIFKQIFLVTLVTSLGV